MNNSRVFIISLVSIFFYIAMPKILLHNGYDMWGSFITSPVIYNGSLISYLDIITSFVLLFSFIKIGSRSDIDSARIDIKIYAGITLGMAVFFFEFTKNIISDYFIEGSISRNAGADYWSLYINNGFASYLMTLSLIFIIPAYKDGNFLFVLFVCFILFIETLSGMRSEYVRLLLIILAFVPIKKIIIYYTIPIILLILNRQIYFNYDYNLRSIFGDAINVMYGYSQLDGIEPTGCNAFYSIARIVIPPIFRSMSFEYAGDLVVCLNSLYYTPSGLGNSILTDINYYPIELLTIFLLYLLIVNCIPNGYKLFISIFVISMVPHIMRLGFITGISYTISFIIWIFMPIIYLNKLISK